MSIVTPVQVSSHPFVHTPALDRIVNRALRFLQSGYSIHFRGPAGTGKTTLAMHLANLLARPTLIMFGDDEFSTADLLGSHSGYTRKKVVDSYIHNVVKVEDELHQNWTDARLTLACRQGLTLIYDEFNRSRPEVNNVLLSALEEKMLVLPRTTNQTEPVRVHPQFRAIFTSNPEEYCGVHSTQDALLDRLITIHIPEPDELTQQEILVQNTGIGRGEAEIIVQVVKGYRAKTGATKMSGLRSCLMLATVCQEHNILVAVDHDEFREFCSDVLISRSGLGLEEANQQLWSLFESMRSSPIEADDTFLYEEEVW